MTHIAVKSSNVASLGYDPDTSVLEVRFLKSGLYRYHGVPNALFEALKVAPSIGKLLDARVKKKYRCEKVEEEAEAAA